MIEDLLRDSQDKKSSKSAVLPPEDLAQILSSIQTILSLYVIGGDDDETEDEGELEIDENAEKGIKGIADYLNLPLNSLGDKKSLNLQNSLPDFVKIGIRLKPWKGTNEIKSKINQFLILNIFFQVRKKQNLKEQDDDLLPSWSLQKATWLEEEKREKLVKIGKNAENQLKDRIKQEKGSNSNTDEPQDLSGNTVSMVLLIAEAITEAILEM